MKKYLLEVKPSRVEGKGLFARSNISGRRKIGELNGELITQAEARRRARQKQHIAIVELGNGKAIDASRQGNEFKFVNHSCSPNTYMRVCYGRVEFYTLRDIARGEELTCNYGITHHDGKLPCRCGSPRCRGYL